MLLVNLATQGASDIDQDQMRWLVETEIAHAIMRIVLVPMLDILVDGSTNLT